MKHDYTELDAAILARLGEGRATFTQLQGGKVQRAADEFGTGLHGMPAWRFIDRRLQALRKAGLITYQRKPEGWSLAAPGATQG